MIHAGANVLVYAFVAAASPLVLTATFVVIRSTRPRAEGIAFLAGFVLGTVVACSFGLLVGEAAVSRLESHGAVEQFLALLLGLALMSFGLRSRRGAPTRDPDGGRTVAILARLGRVGPAAAFSAAALLGFGGPKRLVLTLLAMAAITGAGLPNGDELTLVAVYVVVSTVLVWALVGIVLVAGERAAAILGRGESWLTTHATSLRVWLSLGLGAVITVHALARLLA